VTKGALVTITVAKKPAATAVPDVTGKSAADAVSELSGAGFKVVQKTKDVPTADQDGVVLGQDPAAPEKLKSGQTVTITIGNYVAPVTPTTPTPTPTTPTTPTPTTPTTPAAP
jgi:beta-lactam-binding protein with PASTA domain